MPREHGDPALLMDPVAQELLQSAIPARLAYAWTDGSPRVVPLWFHWTGDEVVFVSPSNAPKLQAIEEGSTVALTIDTEVWPAKCLNIRGRASVRRVAGEPDELLSMYRKYLGKDAEEFRGVFIQNFPEPTRIAVRPAWVDILDIPGGRLPSAWG